jgi:hypothetical protein
MAAILGQEDGLLARANAQKRAMPDDLSALLSVG